MPFRVPLLLRFRPIDVTDHTDTMPDRFSDIYARYIIKPQGRFKYFVSSKTDVYLNLQTKKGVGSVLLEE